jgi:hypothetical protein
VDFIVFKVEFKKPVVVIHTYNPSYLESGGWEDRGLRPIQAES